MRSVDGHGATTRDATARLLAPFARDVLLATGRPVRVRPAEADDVAALRRFYGELSEASTYFRFFGVRRSIPEAELLRATAQDTSDHVTLVVDANGELIAVGEYFAQPGGEDAEVAFAVADAHHQEGIATVLVEDLAAIAKEAGFRRLVAQVLPDNVGMQRVFRDVGLVHRSWFEGGVVHVHLDLTADDLLQDRADLRDWASAVRSLEPILHPRHIVVVGGGDEASPGARIVEHLTASFDGKVSVVDQSSGRIDDAQLDGVPDLAIVATPAMAVTEVVEQCGAIGLRCAVVVTAGFAESGAASGVLQADVLAAARRHGMRLVGPDSLGIVSTACGLNGTYTNQRFNPGGIAIASQSGGVGIAIAAEVERRDAGVSSFVSMGNKADVSGNDLLRLWVDDDATRVILLYLESFGDPVRFARIARAVSQRKPVVALKGGRSASRVRSERSPVAAWAGDTDAVKALFSHTGVIRARTLEELIDIGLLLDRQPAPRGRRLALVGNAGGPLVLGAAAADDAGAAVPELSAELQGTLTKLAPAATSCSNPVDAGTSSPHNVAELVRTIAASGEVDACVAVYVELDQRHVDEAVAILDTVDVIDVPVAVTVIGGSPRRVERLPMFPTPERAATAMGRAGGRAAWLSRSAAAKAAGIGIDAAPLIATRRLARRLGPEEAAPTELGQDAAFELLESAGVCVAPWQYARSAQECARVIECLARPCVVKADVADVVYEEGAVRPGITDVESAADVYRDFQRRFGDRLRGVVVQSQVPAGLELCVEAIRDQAFGPFVVVGAGGVESDVREDRAVLVAPVTAAEAREAVEGLHLAPLFHGFRGRPVLPMDSVVELVTTVAALIAAVPEIQRLRLNPVIVGPSSAVAVDALVGLSVPHSPIAPARALRGPVGALP